MIRPVARDRRSDLPEKTDVQENTPSPVRGDEQHMVGRFEAFAGPIPHPDHFAAYEQALPGAADRILKLAEAQSAHRQRQEKRAQDALIQARTRGQWFGFIMATVCLGLGGYLSASGVDIIGGVVLTVGLAQLGFAIYGKFRALLRQDGERSPRPREEGPPRIPSSRRRGTAGTAGTQ